jgi:hypothetical protein
VIILRKLNRPIRLAAALSAAAAILIFTSAAVANSGKVIADCNSHGYLTGHYSRSELQSALNGMGADVREYTNCYDVISRALGAVAAAGGGHGGGGGSSSGGPGGTGATGHSAAVSTRGVYSHVRNAVAAGPGSKAPVLLSGSPVSPGATGIGTSSDAHTLPTPLLIVLIALGLATAGGGGIAVRRRVVARGGG